MKSINYPSSNINNSFYIGAHWASWYCLIFLSYLVPFIIFDVIVFLRIFLPPHSFRNVIYSYPIRCVPSSLHTFAGTYANWVASYSFLMTIFLSRQNLQQEEIENIVVMPSSSVSYLESKVCRFLLTLPFVPMWQLT